jgi:hypothetical protein
LRSQKLEIFFVDENCPLTGIPRGQFSEGAEGDDDLIGRIEIPLDSLAEKQSIGSTQGKEFVLKNMKQ